MLEAFAIPVLNKAVDFLFSEGSKILQERRERRNSLATGAAKPVPVPNPQGTLQPKLKESLLQQQVNDIAWKTHEAEVQHLLSLLEIYSKNYHLAKQQYAKWGDELVPQIVAHRLEDAENNVAQTTAKLQQTLSLVFEKDLAVIEVEPGG